MPTYEYICGKCRKSFEMWQKISEAPMKFCPDEKCRGRVKRTIGGGAGFLLKGSGFYATDYRSPDYKKKAVADKPAKPSEAKPSEVKPATPSKKAKS
jgi:putative FmdB family regulatory protein